MIDDQKLSEVLSKGVDLYLVEPGIYSVLPQGEAADISYDKKFGDFYDRVACSRIYNRLVWGYSISEYHTLCREALSSATDGWVLDAGCGSLAFSAKAYADYSARTVILLDRSIRLLRIAKGRLQKLCGGAPPNLVLLHADALDLPFQPGSFRTVISLNLLHVLEAAAEAVRGLNALLAKGGTMTFTTLVENDRLADRYLHMWGRTGELVPRGKDQLASLFGGLELAIDIDIKGNLAFVRCT